MSVQDFLFEIGGEELPPKSLSGLASALADGVLDGLTKAGLSHDGVTWFAAPRRLAVQVRALAAQQPDRVISVDGPPVQAAFTADGQPYTVKRLILGSAPAKLPIAEPQCPELQELIHQLEQLPAPDGFRRITHLLVDAGARDFTVVDPSPSNIIATPPAIGFTVASAKFQGRVTVLYERGLDLYAMELRRDDELVERVDEVSFDALGQVLERLIDDGSWRLIRVQRLSGRKPVQH